MHCKINKENENMFISLNVNTNLREIGFIGHILVSNIGNITVILLLLHNMYNNITVHVFNGLLFSI